VEPLQIEATAEYGRKKARSAFCIPLNPLPLLYKITINMKSKAMDLFGGDECVRP